MLELIKVKCQSPKVNKSENVFGLPLPYFGRESGSSFEDKSQSEASKNQCALGSLSTRNSRFCRLFFDHFLVRKCTVS